MENPLRTEQVLLLVNLLYMRDIPPFKDISVWKGWTVGEIAGAVPATELLPRRDYGGLVTGAEWRDMLRAVQVDPALCQVVLLEVCREEGSGVSALFANPGAGEALVLFGGTAKGEWRDNFLGGGPTSARDGVSTPAQERALAWYRSLPLSEYAFITVGGHSKGGNKAKYIALLDNSPDRCLSFDGQGFSDEFFARYPREIARRQGVIENHNVDWDFVHLLLFDVGRSRFYQGQNIGGFLENHSPNSFFRFAPDGSARMVPGERSPEMDALDGFLDAYLRTAAGAEKSARLSMLGSLAETAAAGGGREELTHFLLRPDSLREWARFAACLSWYAQRRPQETAALGAALERFGMGELLCFVRLGERLMGWEHFDRLLAFLGRIGEGGGLAAALWEKPLSLIRETLDVDLNPSELMRLSGFLSQFAQARGELPTEF